MFGYGKVHLFCFFIVNELSSLNPQETRKSPLPFLSCSIFYWKLAIFLLMISENSLLDISRRNWKNLCVTVLISVKSYLLPASMAIGFSTDTVRCHHSQTTYLLVCLLGLYILRRIIPPYTVLETQLIWRLIDWIRPQVSVLTGVPY